MLMNIWMAVSYSHINLSFFKLFQNLHCVFTWNLHVQSCKSLTNHLHCHWVVILTTPGFQKLALILVFYSLEEITAFINGNYTIHWGKLQHSLGEITPFNSGNYTIHWGKLHHSLGEITPFISGNYTIHLGKLHHSLVEITAFISGKLHHSLGEIIPFTSGNYTIHWGKLQHSLVEITPFISGNWCLLGEFFYHRR